LQGNVQSFKAKLNLQVKYYYDTHRTCITGYYDLDDFVARLQLTLAYLVCEKSLLWSFWSFDNWSGPNAKWIDKCSLSSQETLDLFDKEYKVLENTYYFIGAETPTEANCLPGLLWTTSPFGAVYERVQDNLVWYVQ
jgi:hypothetical protein